MALLILDGPWDTTDPEEMRGWIAELGELREEHDGDPEAVELIDREVRRSQETLEVLEREA